MRSCLFRTHRCRMFATLTTSSSAGKISTASNSPRPHSAFKACKSSQVICSLQFPLLSISQRLTLRRSTFTPAGYTWRRNRLERQISEGALALDNADFGHSLLGSRVKASGYALFASARRFAAERRIWRGIVLASVTVSPARALPWRCLLLPRRRQSRSAKRDAYRYVPRIPHLQGKP